MDDFNVSSLHESKNEWGSRLLTILTPLIVEGLRSIFDEANKLCRENNEGDKYLMTFQNFISRIPKWNPSIIETERKRICDRSGCGYLEDLVTCVHIIQLKLLSAVRAGNKQKKIDINIPKLDDFIHKSYIHVARKVYKNVYLFETNIPPLQMQKNQRELEVIVQECILNAVRESIPVENILRAYMDESVEEDIVEEVKEEFIETPKEKEENKINEQVDSLIAKQEAARLSFNDVDMVKDTNNNIISVTAPKDPETLEQISNIRNEQRKLESLEDDDGEKLKIMDEIGPLGAGDIQLIGQPNIELMPDLLIDDIEVLP
jgi:Family of unknown function (DUF5764)